MLAILTALLMKYCRCRKPTTCVAYVCFGIEMHGPTDILKAPKASRTNSDPKLYALQLET